MSGQKDVWVAPANERNGWYCNRCKSKVTSSAACPTRCETCLQSDFSRKSFHDCGLEYESQDATWIEMWKEVVFQADKKINFIA